MGNNALEGDAVNHKSIFTHTALTVVCILGMTYVSTTLLRCLFFIGLGITLLNFFWIITKMPDKANPSKGPETRAEAKAEKSAGSKTPCMFCEAVTVSSSMYCDHCGREVQGCLDCGSCKVCGRESV